MSGQEAFTIALNGNKDLWVPANGGDETPFISRSGRKLLYCFNPKLGKHAYLDCSTDIILSQKEAEDALQICLSETHLSFA